MINRRNLIHSLGLAGFFGSNFLTAADNYRLNEVFSPGNRFRVQTTTELSGFMNLINGNQQKQIQIKGRSLIDFDETVLSLDSSFKVSKSLRDYRKVELSRILDGQNQETTLRPIVRRLILARQGSKKIPFSLDSHLTWSELDLIRTEVCPCSLEGLFPTRMVGLNESWNTGLDAVRELTDLELLESSTISCRLDSVNLVNNRQTARIVFQGKVSGVNEDGPNQQILDGYLFFDCETRHLSFLYLKGTSILKNKEGVDVGKIEGRYTLSRDMLPAIQLDGRTLSQYEPDGRNTRLSFDSNGTGFTFLYPRSWKVTSQSGHQATLDYSKDSGLLITMDDSGKYSSGKIYRDQVLGFIQKQQMRIEKQELLQVFNGMPGVEFFSWDVEDAGRRFYLLYYFHRLDGKVFTFSCKCPSENKAIIQNEIPGIVVSTRPVEKGR